MVVHTPTKLEVLRRTAADRRASTVPPSVAAAAAAAAAGVADAAGAAGATTPPDGDLLGGLDQEDPREQPACPADDPLAHEFDAWNGVHPPGIEVRDSVAAAGAGREEEHVNVTTRDKRTATTSDKKDEDLSLIHI